MAPAAQRRTASQTRKAGFDGLDLYSMSRSAHEVIGYLKKVDPEAARRAQYRYSCFDHYGEDTQAYGYAANFGMGILPGRSGSAVS